MDGMGWDRAWTGSGNEGLGFLWRIVHKAEKDVEALGVRGIGKSGMEGRLM